MATTIKLKNGTGAPSAGALVVAEPALDLTNKRLYTEDSGGTVIEVGTNPGEDVTFADDRKAVFGAGSDLEIYHESSTGRSFIKETGADEFRILGSNIRIKNGDDSKTYMQMTDGGSVAIRHNDATKLETTSTGIDVTGTVTADGLTVDGSATIQSTSSPAISVIDTTNNVEARLQAFNSTATVGTQSNHSFSIETNDTNRALFATNGDISFYEDTGTTAKLFWDASEESLGIGTSSPSSYGHSLVVAKDASGGATYATITNTNANQFLNLGINADVAEITWDNADSLAFGTTAASTDEGQTFEAMRISSSGNVGIGTDSPSAPLSFGANIPSDGQTIHTYHSGNTRSGLGVVAGVHRVFTNSSSALSFGQVSDSDGSTYTERMRIDSSGNLLVGTTNTLPQTLTSGGGFCYAPDSSLRIARQSDGTGQPTLDLNNTGSDDEIIRFRKDGTTVGSIGVLSNRLYIGSGDTGIKFSGADDLISPIDASDGTGRNGFIDLGSSGARFKDLYLSGGAYLGGTAAANKLDDYEEGTWTPAPTSGTLNAGATGSYVKIGNLVHVQGQLSFSANGTTNRIDGLPFRPRIEAALSSIRQRFLIYATTSSTAIYGSCQDNNDALFLQDENRTAHDFDTADGVYTFAFTYET